MLYWDSGIGATPALVSQYAQGTPRLFSRRAGLACANSRNSSAWLWSCVPGILMRGEAGPEARSKRPPGGRSRSVVRNCGLILKSLGGFLL